MPTQNDSLRDLQSILVRQFKKLSDSLDTVTDATVGDAVVREMQELNHRIGLTGGLLFSAQAKELDEKVADVSKATRKANAAIANLQNLQAFLAVMSEFLGLVDEAIDLAKLV